MKMRLFAFVLLIVMLSTSVATADAEKNLYRTGSLEYCYYINEDGSATICGVGHNSKYPSYLYFPSTINGYQVTVISGGIDGYGRTCSVFDNEGSDYKVSGYYYFWPNNGLWDESKQVIRNITIPDGVHTITNSAFSFCDAYVSFTLPHSIKMIGDKAFFVGYGYCLKETDIYWENIEYIGKSAFRGCEGLHTIKNLTSLRHLDNNAFERCTSLIRIDLPDTLEYIGDNPFVGCTSLNVINVDPNHPLLAYVNGVLFEKTSKRLVTYLPSLTGNEYVIPDGIREIGGYAFYECNKLQSVSIPPSVTRIGERAFLNNIRAVTIPASVISIGEFAFSSKCVLTVESGSYAHTYAMENGYMYQLVDADMSWLSD